MFSFGNSCIQLCIWYKYLERNEINDRYTKYSYERIYIKSFQTLRSLTQKLKHDSDSKGCTLHSHFSQMLYFKYVCLLFLVGL